MRFNRFIWSLFCSSKAGRAAISRYESFLERGERWAELAPKSWTEKLRMIDVMAAQAVFDEAVGRRVASHDHAGKLYERLLDEGFTLSLEIEDGDTIFTVVGGDELEAWLSMIQGISLGLFKAHPEHFALYLFLRQFNRFSELCDEFGIAVPVLPGKASWQDRAMFYLRINASLQEFRRIHGLTPAELCAFLYDFAPHHLAQERGELPPASKVWFLMGGAGGSSDFDFVDAAGDDATSYWQGNVDTRRGDIMVMWCVSPRSYVHSIWRAETDGFIDPFFHYHSTVWISTPVKVPKIPFREIAADPVWSKKPAVKAHFQGASGKPVTAEEYEALLRMIKRKRGKISDLPRLHRPDLPDQDDVESEREVEQKLLEPLLRELGYVERDWIRNMPVRMGRGERVYPDYAIGAVLKRGEETARIIVEAKRELATEKQILDAYQQAKSYAQRLQSAAFVLVAREGIWIFLQEQGGFLRSRFLHRSWADLRGSDGLHEVKLLIGKAKSRVWAAAPRVPG